MTKAEKKKEPELTFNDAYDVLHHMQVNLKAPKGQYNKFGNYHYRSCEDILEGIKKVLPDGATVVITDDIISVSDRVYVRANAVLSYKGVQIANAGYARESLSKKGMDDSQITGSASSYARKYALNGLFLIDDTKDADATEKHGKDRPEKAFESPRDGLDDEQVKQMYNSSINRLNDCATLERLQTEWKKIYSGRSVFTQEQWADIEQKKDEMKEEIEKGNN